MHTKHNTINQLTPLDEKNIQFFFVKKREDDIKKLTAKEQKRK